ncbi:transglycosylase SLT domain-containing protein [Burkholderia multivorans]|uniref:lytic transglycosylase domain-containing protein n=1 Tax=Burkholderia multivorans TaxID=87883 RepID=UPI001C95216E|nr:transglycosylase SLT domain-containing protein [Burkholderia multivorans]MBY4673894.1 transglycosylase SLT domain-containing protein [Burkholderia multivorans]
MMPPTACIAEASSTYHVQTSAIEAIIAHGLPAGVERDGRVGPMGIPVQWLPIFELMGISRDAVVSDACENILAGTWIMAYMTAIQSVQVTSSGQGAYAARAYAQSPALAKRRQAWAPVVQAAAAETGVPAALLDAVITVESGYQPNAVSKSSPPAIGMMQLLGSTAAMFGGDPWDGVQNIRMGARYLAQLARQFGGDLNLTLAAYNAGPAAVTRHGYRIPPFAETRAYVPNVLAIYASARQ